MEPFPLPLPSEGPPKGFGFQARTLSQVSSSTAFNTGINQRDTFAGSGRCVICGMDITLEHAHIIPQSHIELQRKTWDSLKARNYIPQGVKTAEHEPRNGLLMCATHHQAFDNFYYYIRYIPDTKQLVFVNQSDVWSLSQFHGKAILMDMDHQYAPFPALFLVHEQRVRGFCPWAKPVDVPASIVPQDWIVSSAQRLSSGGGNVVSNAGPSYTAAMGNSSGQAAPRTNQPTPGHRTLTLDSDTIQQILFATRNSESWKACVREGTSWEGTADENIAKYKEQVPL